jgi:hypothetical protein
MSVRHDITEKTLSQGSYRVLHAGDDYDYQFTVKRVGVAINLTGAKIWFTIKARDTEDDNNAKLQLTSDTVAEIEVTDAPNGVFLVKFRAEGAKSTANLAGEWIYDMQVKTSDPEIITLARGIIEFLPNLTRSTT